MEQTRKTEEFDGMQVMMMMMMMIHVKIKARHRTPSEKAEDFGYESSERG